LSTWFEQAKGYLSGFNALFGTIIAYKALYKPVAKPHFTDSSRAMAERLMLVFHIFLNRLKNSTSR